MTTSTNNDENIDEPPWSEHTIGKMHAEFDRNGYKRVYRIVDTSVESGEAFVQADQKINLNNVL